MTFARLDHELAQRRDQGLYRQRRILTSGNDTPLSYEDRPYLNFSSNDYLGLAQSPRIKQAAADGALQYGVGSGGSALITGHSPVHHRLESMIAEMTGLPGVLLFTSGFSANSGVINTLLGKDDLLLQDKLNHASLIDAGRHCAATMKRFLHNDMASLTRLSAKESQGDTLIVTEGIFSMDGDAAPLADMAAICRANNAALMVDDAHGFGIAADGAGSCAAAAVVPDILMATFGKAVGTSGAFVAADSPVIDYLVNFCRHYIYTTAISPAIAAATVESLILCRAETWRQNKLNELIAQFKAGIARLGLSLVPSDSAIQPLLIGDPQRALALAERLRQRGIWLTAIRPPTVPVGGSRLRITLTANHTPADIDTLINALEQEYDSE